MSTITYHLPPADEEHEHNPGGAVAGTGAGGPAASAPAHEPSSVTHQPGSGGGGNRDEHSGGSVDGIDTAKEHATGFDHDYEKDKQFAPVVAGAAGAGAAGAKGVDGVEMAPVTTAAAPRKRLTYLERHPEHADGHWSRGKKICCGLLLLLLAILITMGVLIAFMVRMPSVTYKSVEIICPDNGQNEALRYYACARETVQFLVFLEVDNPNILGATINADLALYKEDGTFLGPGRVEDTYVNKRGQTELQALFNLTSSRGYDIIRDLYVPPQRSRTLTVKGTVYVHVGLIRPSSQFEQEIVVPPQDAIEQASGLFGAIGGFPSAGEIVDGVVDGVSGVLPDPPSTDDVIDAGAGAVSGAIPDDVSDAGSAVADQIPDGVPGAVADQIPDGVPGAVADQIPNIPGFPRAENSDAAAAPATTTTTTPADDGKDANTSSERARPRALSAMRTLALSTTTTADKHASLNVAMLRSAILSVRPTGATTQKLRVQRAVRQRHQLPQTA